MTIITLEFKHLPQNVIKYFYMIRNKTELFTWKKIVGWGREGGTSIASIHHSDQEKYYTISLLILNWLSIT